MEIIMRPVTTVLTLLVMLVPLPAAAQRSTRQDEEVMNYRLSMEKLHKLLQVQRALNAANAKDPQLFERIDEEALAAAKKNGGPLTVGQKVAIFERHPEAQRVFASAGGTAREWLLTAEAMGNAAIAVETKKGTLTGPPPTTDAQKANVALLEKNEAEWQKILEELDRLANELVNE
jgi:hypothetical protein